MMYSVSPTARGVFRNPLSCDENSTVLLGIVKWYYSHAHGGTHVTAGLWSSGFYQFGEGAMGLNFFQSHRIKLGIQVFVPSWFWLASTHSDCVKKNQFHSGPQPTHAGTGGTGFVENDNVLSEEGLLSGPCLCHAGCQNILSIA